ncbi:MAG: relaxase/mobilization nuclease domain-containing protein [Clostridia bacterium]|nr:relaxase/mobilization nuclease domain-containing protein [Clostridia bacterium]
MPIFIVRNSKATPGDAIEYITRPGKAAHISVRNLMTSENLAKQIMDTMKDFGKGTDYNERKYYHCKLSPSRAEKISFEDMQRYAEEMVDAVFDPEMQVIIATHFDTGNPHAHIIVGAMNPVTGKKLHYTRRDFGYMKDTANDIGLEYGLTPIDFREKSSARVKQGEIHAKKTTNPTTKDRLREAITEAIQASGSEEEYLEYMDKHNIKITRSKTEFSYLYPGARRAVRGDTLGEIYKKDSILKAIYEMETDDPNDDELVDTSGDDGRAFNPEKVTELYGDDFISRAASGAESHSSDGGELTENEVDIPVGRVDIRQNAGDEEVIETRDESAKTQISIIKDDEPQNDEPQKVQPDRHEARPPAVEKKTNPAHGQDFHKPFVSADTAFEKFCETRRKFFDSLNENQKKEVEDMFKKDFKEKFLKEPALSASSEGAAPVKKIGPTQPVPRFSPIPEPTRGHDDYEDKFKSK